MFIFETIPSPTFQCLPNNIESVPGALWVGVWLYNSEHCRGLEVKNWLNPQDPDSNLQSNKPTNQPTTE